MLAGKKSIAPLMLTTNNEVVFLAFSFGPFIGFWAAYEGGKEAGCTVVPGGDQFTKERLHSMLENEATEMT
ncbi:hypothetical protein [Salsuginibacillus kocurii]|uniref:hypothetical protein n=1 Tax=Salsuginibacillus kocurii TaxID=427078 RepID=UPI000475F484|nr:hypothetical protein [Salsuginibacillus kocurii]